MISSKEQIIKEIKRMAEANQGIAPGKGSFEQETGIRSAEWEGKYWTKWSDALIEAGLEPNVFGTPAYEEDFVLGKIAMLTRELTHLPTRNEIRLRKRSDAELPTDNTIRNKFGSKKNLVARLLQFANENPSYRDLIPILEVESNLESEILSNDLSLDTDRVGYVYLMRHGNRKEYKIGFTVNPIRREGEISVQLPEKVTPIHTIQTDDPAGIEAYWHKRFASKRKNGEWFELSSGDVKSFKKWKKIY